MATVSGTATVVTVGGTSGIGRSLPEDLSDIIYNISPTDCPFSKMIGRSKANAVKHEWLTDSLAAADTTNAFIEGEDATFATPATTIRLSNYTQIFKKTGLISGTVQAVSTKGYRDQLAYEIMKRTKEIKRDIEAVHVGLSQITTQGSASAARKSCSVVNWIATNDDLGGSGVSGDPTASPQVIRTDGTVRAFTEGLLKNVNQLIFAQGGEPDVLMVGPVNKQKVSAFAGNATRFDRSEDKRLVTSVDIYEHDYGVLKVVANRFMRERDGLVLQTDMWAYADLRPLKREALGKTGDGDKFQLITELTLESKNEAASGLVADLATS
jgi:hypothetical protein